MNLRIHPLLFIAWLHALPQPRLGAFSVPGRVALLLDYSDRTSPTTSETAGKCSLAACVHTRVGHCDGRLLTWTRPAAHRPLRRSLADPIGRPVVMPPLFLRGSHTGFRVSVNSRGERVLPSHHLGLQRCVWCGASGTGAQGRDLQPQGSSCPHNQSELSVVRIPGCRHPLGEPASTFCTFPVFPGCSG